MSVFLPDRKDLEREIAIQQHPLYGVARGPVRLWLGRLREATTAKDYYELQAELLACFRWSQDSADAERARQKELRDEVKAASRDGADKQALKALNDEITMRRLNVDVHHALLAVYRGLADAMAWRLFRYQRPVTTAIAGGRVVGRLSDEGLVSELGEVEWNWHENETFALLADLTTCVRHGDVWAFDRLDPPEVYITEAKQSGRLKPNSAQAKRLARLVELLEQGAHPTAAAGGPLAFRRPGIALKTHHERLRELVDEARRGKYARGLLEPGVMIEVWDEDGVHQPATEDQSNEAMREEMGWSDDLEVITASAALVRIRSRRLDHNFAGLAPLALTPLDLADAADLVTGGLDFISTLHLPAVAKCLEGAGIEIEIARGQEASNWFMKARRGGVQITVPAQVREQVQVELMTLETLTALVDWSLTDLASRGEGVDFVPFFEGEPAVWEPVAATPPVDHPSQAECGSRGGCAPLR